MCHIQENSDQNRTKAKQDVELLVGKTEKKKKKSKSELGTLSLPNQGGIGPLGPLTLERKPLPGIQPKVSCQKGFSISLTYLSNWYLAYSYLWSQSWDTKPNR